METQRRWVTVMSPEQNVIFLQTHISVLAHFDVKSPRFGGGKVWDACRSFCAVCSMPWTLEEGFARCLRSEIFAPCFSGTRVWGWESYQQIRAERLPSHIPQTRFQMVERRGVKNSGSSIKPHRPIPLLPRLFSSLSRASLHLRISRGGGCLINPSRLHFGGSNSFIMKNKSKAPRAFFVLSLLQWLQFLELLALSSQGRG